MSAGSPVKLNWTPLMDRSGLGRIYAVTSSARDSSIAQGIAGNTICALGDAAAWPMLGFLTKFRADFEAKVAGRSAV